MGEVNDVLCNYFSIPEIFADFWNGTLFEGKQELKGEYLHKHDREYYKLSKRSGRKATSIRRDVNMHYQAEIEVILGMEILDSIDYSMAVRLMDYDVQEMKRQLQEIMYRNRREMEENDAWKHSGEFLYGVKKEDRLLPVISVALYCGKGHYDGARDIADMFKTLSQRNRLQALVKNYPTCIYELSSLVEENYHTGLRELIAIFKRSKDKASMLNYYEQHKERFRKLDVWTIEAIGVLIGKKLLNLYTQEGEGLDMCKAFEDAIAEGRAEGRAEGAFGALSDLVRDGMLKLEEAARRLNMTEEAFRAKMQA